MKTLTIRDFRTRPRQAQKALADEGEALLTSNGRPVALMLRVDSDSLDQTMRGGSEGSGLNIGCCLAEDQLTERDMTVDERVP